MKATTRVFALGMGMAVLVTSGCNTAARHRDRVYNNDPLRLPNAPAIEKPVQAVDDLDTEPNARNDPGNMLPPPLTASGAVGDPGMPN